MILERKQAISIQQLCQVGSKEYPNGVFAAWVAEEIAMVTIGSTPYTDAQVPESLTCSQIVSV